MPHENRPATWRSLGLGLTLGVGGALAVWLLAGCGVQATSKAPVQPVGPPLPVNAPAVILATDVQRGTLLASLTAGASNTLTIVTGQPPAIAAVAPPQKRGKLTLAWNASQDPSVVGFRLYYGLVSGSWMQSADVGLTTRATIIGLEEGTRYYFVATSYDATGLESPFSNEASGVTDIYIALRQERWSVEAYGLHGKTNLIRMSTNLSQWQTLKEFVGDGSLQTVLHTNREKAWFRVEAK